MQVEAHAVERAQRKIKCHRPQVATATNGSKIKISKETLHNALKQVENATEIENILLNERNDQYELDIEEEEGEEKCDELVQAHKIHEKKETIGLFIVGPSKW